MFNSYVTNYQRVLLKHVLHRFTNIFVGPRAHLMFHPKYPSQNISKTSVMEYHGIFSQVFCWCYYNKGYGVALI